MGLLLPEGSKFSQINCLTYTYLVLFISSFNFLRQASPYSFLKYLLLFS